VGRSGAIAGLAARPAERGAARGQTRGSRSDRYDRIVLDECHRGYLLDRELSDTDLGFRSFDDYISK
jgi:type I site-specific restriction endonuclease